MSAGKFTDTTYVTTGGVVTTIRVQPETITAWNPVGVGPVQPGLPSARVSGGIRRIGINARHARFRWKGAVPDTYDPAGIITVPILTEAAFTALVKNTDYAYLGQPLRLVGKSSERIR